MEELNIIEIKFDIKFFSDDLLKDFKKVVIKKFIKIWVKIRREGIKLIKDLYLELRKKIIKGLVEGGVENLGDFINFLN